MYGKKFETARRDVVTYARCHRPQAICRRLTTAADCWRCRCVPSRMGGGGCRKWIGMDGVDVDVDGSWIYLDMAGVSIHPFPAGSTGRVGAENAGAGVRVNVKVNTSVNMEANMSVNLNV